MVASYYHNISAWMDGTEGLDDGEYRAYHVVCQLVYFHEGPIVYNESGLAGRCNQHPLAFRRNFQKLLDKKKIVRTPDGKITNNRAEVEIEKIHGRRRSKQTKTPAPPPPGSSRVAGGSGGGSARKPLKNNDPPPTSGDPSYPIPKKDSVGANAPTPPPAASGKLFEEPAPVKQEAPDARVYRRGKQVLGESAGGVIRKLIEHHGGNLALAVASIEQASTKQSPREWIAGILRNKPGQRPSAPSRSGFAALAAAELFAEEDDHDGPTLDLHATVPAAGDQRVAHVPALPDKRRSR